MIRSVRIHEFGGPEVLRIEKIEVEEPGEGEVRMRIRGIGINRTEITLRSGRSPVKPPRPASSALRPQVKSKPSALASKASRSGIEWLSCPLSGCRDRSLPWDL
jgi:hypothetical protein